MILGFFIGLSVGLVVSLFAWAYLTDKHYLRAWKDGRWAGRRQVEDPLRLLVEAHRRQDDPAIRQMLTVLADKETWR